MFEDRSYKRTFYSKPMSVSSAVAALLEPAIIVLTYLVVALAFGAPIERAGKTLCLLAFLISFPGINRFKDRL